MVLLEAKPMNLTTAQKQLNHALKNLDRVANYLEGAGLTAQSDNVDGAADRIQDVLDTLESL
jgi:hypothetical protein